MKIQRGRHVGLSIVGVAALATALVGCTESSSVPPGGGGSGWTRDIPASIAGDCSADVTTQMQSWIDSLPNGSTATLRSGGCYDVESDTLLIQNKADFTLEGNGATIHRFREPTGGGLRQVQFVNSTNVAVRDLNIVGPNSRRLGYQKGGYWEGQAGLGVAVNGAVVNNVYVTEVFGDGINLSGGGRNIRIINSRVGQASRQGIAITNASNVTIEYTTIEMAHRMGIDLEPYASTDRVDNVRIVNNSICGNYGPIAGYAHWGVTNVVIASDIYCWGGPIAF